MVCKIRKLNGLEQFRMKWNGQDDLPKHGVKKLKSCSSTFSSSALKPNSLSHFLSYLPLVCLTYFSHSISFPFFIFFNYSIPFYFFSNYSISFHFFSIIFFNFPNPYIISLNLNHLYHLKICKVKPFLHHFSKSFSNHSKLFSNHFFHPKK